MRSLMTIVVPCYNEQEALPLFMEAIAPVRDTLSGEAYACDTELIFIDDGSKDCTLKLLREYHEADSSVQYISFSRNFGKEAGIFAGLKASKGDYVVLLDADLQHPVGYIPRMYSILSGRPSYVADVSCASPSPDNTGAPDDCLVHFPDECNSVKCPYDSVAMYRPNRNKSGKLRAFFSRSFFRMMNKLSKIDLVDGATDYRMMTRRMVDSVLEMQEYNRFTKGIFNWIGYNTLWLPYEDTARVAGESKWSFGALLRYAFEGMFAFSTAPLTASFTIGTVLCVLAVVYAVITVVKTLIWGDPVAGFPSLFTMILLLGGIQLLFLGIIGQYLSKMYLETKHRPIYITKETSLDK